MSSSAACCEHKLQHTTWASSPSLSYRGKLYKAATLNAFWVELKLLFGTIILAWAVPQFLGNSKLIAEDPSLDVSYVYVLLVILSSGEDWLHRDIFTLCMNGFEFESSWRWGQSGLSRLNSSWEAKRGRKNVGEPERAGLPQGKSMKMHILT